MSKDIQFSVNKTKVNEGDYVVVTWDCDCPDAVSLTVDNGYSSYSIQLADSGSRSVTMEKSKGKTTLKLNAVLNGKAERKELEVKVEAVRAPKEKVKKEKVYKARPANARTPFGNPFKNLGPKLKSFLNRLNFGWQAMPDSKRRIWRAVFIAIVIIWIFSLARNIGYKAGYQKGLEDAPQAATVSTIL